MPVTHATKLALVKLLLANSSTLLLAAVLVAAPLDADSATGAYKNDLIFVSEALSQPLVVDFDLSLPGFTISPDPPHLELQLADAFGTTSPPHSLGTDSEDQAFIGGDHLTFHLGAEIQAFGLYFIVEEAMLDPGFFSLTTSSSALAASAATELSSISDGSVFFVGVVDESGFESVTLTSSSIDDLVFNVDDLILMERARVPEPGATASLAAALLSLSSLKRLRRRA